MSSTVDPEDSDDSTVAPEDSISQSGHPQNRHKKRRHKPRDYKQEMSNDDKAWLGGNVNKWVSIAELNLTWDTATGQWVGTYEGQSGVYVPPAQTLPAHMQVATVPAGYGATGYGAPGYGSPTGQTPAHMQVAAGASGHEKIHNNNALAVVHQPRQHEDGRHPHQTGQTSRRQSRGKNGNRRPLPPVWTYALSLYKPSPPHNSGRR